MGEIIGGFALAFVFLGMASGFAPFYVAAVVAFIISLVVG